LFQVKRRVAGQLNFYGEDRPIYVSYGLEQKGEYVDLVMKETGRQVLRKRTQSVF